MIRREVIALELAPRNRQYKSHTFYECPTCGWLRWSCSAGEDEDVSCPELIFLPIDEWEYQSGRGCECCLAVFARAPELAHWVVEVVGKIRRDRLLADKEYKP